jgi:hypothetical protein
MFPLQQSSSSSSSSSLSWSAPFATMTQFAAVDCSRQVCHQRRQHHRHHCRVYDVAQKQSKHRHLSAQHRCAATATQPAKSVAQKDAATPTPPAAATKQAHEQHVHLTKAMCCRSERVSSRATCWRARCEIRACRSPRVECRLEVIFLMFRTNAPIVVRPIAAHRHLGARHVRPSLTRKGFFCFFRIFSIFIYFFDLDCICHPPSSSPIAATSNIANPVGKAVPTKLKKKKKKKKKKKSLSLTQQSLTATTNKNFTHLVVAEEPTSMHMKDKDVLPTQQSLRRASHRQSPLVQRALQATLSKACYAWPIWPHW